MKKLSVILAAVASVMILAAVPAVAAHAADYDEQVVVVEDGVTVVYTTYYVEPDDVIAGQVVTWYNETGVKFVNKYIPRPQEPSTDDGMSMTVTWKDAAGNTYVLDQSTNTVSIYDKDGNLITVVQQ